MKQKIVSFWPIGILFVLTSILFFLNFKSNTYLTGWDNLHPEFYFSLNIQRSFFAVWQEYQGLGLLGGMGHASDLVRQILLLLFSFVMPNEILRYVWTFLMLFLGSAGAYVFARMLLFKNSHSQFPAFSVGLFYLLNLSTLQTFYAPFEAFVAHFGFLPWLLLTSLLFIQTPTKKQLFILTIVLFLGTPASYIPTLFVVYIIALTLFLIPTVISSFNKKTITNVLVLFITIVIVNAFWLFPFAYFTITNSSVNLDSKINQMATETIFLQNKEFGNVLDVMLLRGFWFNNVDPNLDGAFTYMLEPWRQYVSNPFILIIGYLLFAICCIGLIVGFVKKLPYHIAILLLFLFCFTALATDTPPFSIINTLVRENISLLNQAFRFPFTKFSILTSFVFSLLFGIGIYGISKLIQTTFPRYVFYGVCVLGIIAFMFPIFRGHLFYEKETIQIPNEYFETFEYFKKQNPNTRIANFPQHTYWGWNFYTWGYGGSGFLWYGIRQPIIDRAFDVWSSYDENYYFELSQALYSKNETHFNDVLQKYQINYILVDKNVVNPFSAKALFTSELEMLLNNNATVSKDATFGNIDIYKVILNDNPKSFVFFDSQLPVINAYEWDSDDTAYETYGNYIAQFPVKTDPLEYASLTNYYPFRSLFSSKFQKDLEYTVTENQTTIDFISELPENITPSKLSIKPYSSYEKIVPAQIQTDISSRGTVTVLLLMKSPKILLDKTVVWGEDTIYPLFEIQQGTEFPLKLNSNGIADFEITNAKKTLGTTFLTMEQENILTLSNANGESENITISPSDFLNLPFNKPQIIDIPKSFENKTITVQIPKISDNYLSLTSQFNPNRIKNCDNFRQGNISSNFSKIDNRINLSASNATLCISEYKQSLSHDTGYVAFVENENIKGRGLHFWILNEDSLYAPIDTFLPSNLTTSISTFVLPPQDEFGNAYSIHFENISIGNEVTTNNLQNVSLYPISYNFLSQLNFEISKPNTDNSPPISYEVSHPNESLYEITLNSPTIPKNTFIILSQGFDNGWKTYSMSHENTFLSRVAPFIGGSALANHVQINNWENGWELPEDSEKKLVIVYVPQYLQYVGFLLLVLFLLGFLLPFKKPLQKT